MSRRGAGRQLSSTFGQAGTDGGVGRPSLGDLVPPECCYRGSSEIRLVLIVRLENAVMRQIDPAGSEEERNCGDDDRKHHPRSVLSYPRETDHQRNRKHCDEMVASTCSLRFNPALPCLYLLCNCNQWLMVRRRGCWTVIVAVALCTEPQALETCTQNDEVLVSPATVSVCEVAAPIGLEISPDCPEYH
jgi:hypothetical protein